MRIFHANTSSTSGMWIWIIFSNGLISLVVNAATPDPPTNATDIGHKKLTLKSDCSKPIAFSVAKPVIRHEQVTFDETLLNTGTDFNAETGLFTTYCPGLYQFSYFFNGSPDLQIKLTRKPQNLKIWQNVFAAKSIKSLPLNNNLVILRLGLNDQIKLSIYKGQMLDEESSFSGYRIVNE